MVVLIAAGVVLAVWQPWRAAGDSAAAPSSPTTPTTAVTTGPASPPAASETAGPKPTESKPTEPAPTDSATPDASATIAVCSSGEVTVTAKTDKTSYGSDQKPKLSITLTNEGDQPCVMNVGTATQTFIIESGTDTWWRSTDCQSESSDQIVQVEPGASVSSVTPLTWDRTRSSVDTCSGDRSRALPGYYNLTVAIGGIDSEPAQFRLR